MCMKNLEELPRWLVPLSKDNRECETVDISVPTDGYSRFQEIFLNVVGEPWAHENFRN